MNERLQAVAYSHAVAVTPSDSTPLASPARALFIGGAGTLTVDTAGGETSVLFSAVPAGATITLQVTKVHATGTSATGVVALR
jgi:hypothetical protein